MLSSLISDIQSIANPEKAKHQQKFFKTDKGEYGEGDVFLGIPVPEQRKIAKKYSNLTLNQIQELLNSKIHEHRMTGLILLVNKYKKSKKDKLQKRQIYEFYLKNTSNINNWDLVDISCAHIIGDFTLKEGSDLLRDLSKSKNLWEKRIAMISTYSFIRQRKFGETLAIAEILLNDEHDLIHKAVGWMLREVGKRNKNILELFLSSRYKTIPRTMLRYTIEKFPKEERKMYLKGEI